MKGYAVLLQKVKGNEKFIALKSYDGVIVDFKDIFAVFYTSDSTSDKNTEAILCYLFTNDPYIPVFTLVFYGHIGLFAISKSKKGRAAVKSIFEMICPNLTYPVDDAKVLKRSIKQTNTVKGNLSPEFVLQALKIYGKPFDGNLSEESKKMLSWAGYMEDEDIKKILRLNRLSERSFWKKVSRDMTEIY